MPLGLWTVAGPLEPLDPFVSAHVSEGVLRPLSDRGKGRDFVHKAPTGSRSPTLLLILFLFSTLNFWVKGTSEGL